MLCFFSNYFWKFKNQKKINLKPTFSICESKNFKPHVSPWWKNILHSNIFCWTRLCLYFPYKWKDGNSHSSMWLVRSSPSPYKCERRASHFCTVMFITSSLFMRALLSKLMVSLHFFMCSLQDRLGTVLCKSVNTCEWSHASALATALCV